MVKRGFAVAVLAAMFAATGLQTMRAQQGPPAQAYDVANWTAPPGYADAYPESGMPNMAARQGYSTGYLQGQSDMTRGHKYNPHDAKFYKDVPDSPKSLERDHFKEAYRGAFLRGYTQGYKHPHD